MGIESPKNNTEDPDMEFHEHLKRLRESKELTQIQVAEAVGVAKNTYIGYEKGDREPRLSELKKMAELFNIGLGELCLEGRDSGLTGWLKSSFENAKKLRARDKAHLIEVVNGYVLAKLINEMSLEQVPEDVRAELAEESAMRQADEDYELDEMVKLETAIEEKERGF